MNIEFDVIYTVWLREVKGFLRARERIITSLSVPFFWFIIFGTGLASSIQFKNLNTDYSIFLAPGIVTMPLLFTSMMSGISVIWDREFGFLKEMLVAPVSRVSIILGKATGGATIATLQGILILLLFILLGTKPTISLLISLPLMFVIALGFVSLGIAIASLLKTIEGFNLIANFTVMPLFFLSGAFFPITNLPPWLGILSRIDPMTYGVEMLRYIITGTSYVPFYLSLPLILIFTTSTIIIGAYIFTKKE